MRHEIPQFIDIKSKVVGPLTFYQAVYVAGGAGLGYLILKFAPGPFKIILALAVFMFGLALAFYKVNGRDFVYIVQAYVFFKLRGKLYLWTHRYKKKNNYEVSDSQKTNSKNRYQKHEHIDSRRIGTVARGLDILDS